jgi:NHL repeat
VAVDAQGNLYVADYGNNRVLEYHWALVKIDLPLVRH